VREREFYRTAIINNEETIFKVKNPKKKKNQEKQVNKRDLESSKHESISKSTREDNKEKSIWNKIVERVCRMDRTTRFVAPLIVGCVFAIIAYNTWAMSFGGPDSDGRVLRMAFYIVSLILIPIVVFWKKEDNIKIIQCGILCFALSIINSCLLSMWNSSLVDAFYALSFCLAFLSAFMLSKKASKEEIRGEQKDQIKVISQITDTLKQTNSNKKKIPNVKENAYSESTNSAVSILKSGCLLILLVPVVLGAGALYDSRVADNIFDNKKYEEIGRSGRLRDEYGDEYYKVYDPNTKKWGVVKAYFSKGKRTHPNTDESNIVMPLEYDSIQVEHNVDLEDNWNSIYSFYGYKKGRMYDSSGRQIDNKQ